MKVLSKIRKKVFFIGSIAHKNKVKIIPRKAKHKKKNYFIIAKMAKFNFCNINDKF
jgi:hypothetical protein